MGAGPKASRTWSSSLWTRGTITINYPIILMRTPPAAAVEITAVDVPAAFGIVAFAGLTSSLLLSLPFAFSIVIVCVGIFAVAGIPAIVVSCLSAIFSFCVHPHMQCLQTY